MEKDIDLFVEEVVMEMFRGTNEALLEKNSTIGIDIGKQALSNAYQNFYDNEKLALDNKEVPASNYVDKKAKNIGINLDRGKARNDYRNQALGVNPDEKGAVVPKGSWEQAVKSEGEKLKEFLKDYQDIRTTDDADVRAQLVQKWGGYGGIRRYLDMADKLSLTPAYDQENAFAAGINNAPFGTNYKTNKVLKDDEGNPLYDEDEDGRKTYRYSDEETLSSSKPSATPEKRDENGNVVEPYVPFDKVTGYDFENLDLTNVPNSEILKYFKTGTRQKHLYGDPGTGEATNPNKRKKYREMADMAAEALKAKEKGLPASKQGVRAMDDLKNLYFKAMFNKMLNSKFGYDFKMPTAMYTFGNAKLPEDTLVVNFTSAHRCPAWSECLVGYACYARGSEHNYEGLHKKNSNLHLMWASAEHSPELLKAMFNVIKMHLINPGNIATALLNNPDTQQKWYEILGDKSRQFTPLNRKTLNAMKPNKQNLLAMPGPGDEDEPMETEGKSLLGIALNEVIGEAGMPKLKKPTGARDNLAGLIYSKDFSEIFDDKDFAVIKNTPNALRAHFIRLNEEGDFIGQWLVDAFDKFAGELKLIGIHTAAYTCRNLDFTKLQNIIINASTMSVGTKGEKPGEVSNAIARRFFAVSSDLYNRLEDTYVPSGRKFNYTIPSGKLNKKDYDGSKPIVPLHNTSDGLHVKYDLKPYTNDGDTTNPVTFNDRFDPNGPTEKRRLYYKCPCGRHGDVLQDGKPIKMDCYLCRMCYEPKDQKVGEIYVLVEVHGDNIDSFDMNKANQKRGISNKMATYHEARNIFSNRLCEQHKEAERKGLEEVAKHVKESIVDHLGDIGNTALSEQNQIKTESKKFSDFMKRMIKG